MMALSGQWSNGVTPLFLSSLTAADSKFGAAARQALTENGPEQIKESQPY